MNRDIRAMLQDEVRLAHLDQEVEAFSRRLHDDRRRASLATLESAMLGMIELLRDSKFRLIHTLTRR